MGPSCLLWIAHFDPGHGKNCVDLQIKFIIFQLCWKNRSQKVADDSQIKET